MGDAWTDRLSEYIDDELSPRERAALLAHLAGCEECSGIVEELRAVVASAAALPDTPPGRNLWPAIEARLEGDAGVRVISLPERRRRFSFTLPQLAAAGISVVAVSSMMVWLLTRSPAGAGDRVAVSPAAAAGAYESTPAPLAQAATDRAATSTGEEQRAASAPQGARSAPLASSVERVRSGPRGGARFASTGTLDPGVTREYDRAVADLEAVLRRGRSRLQPETIAVVEKSLHDIDGAIAEARRALAKDPANEFLNDHLAESMRLKLELLRQTAALTQS